ncbi:MAG: glycosyltransferase [Acidobacteriota bacterium]|jgi:glycosyltransferase involved in cell wall biosynthesis|nr:glycosyltransferase [Acidobacteriota bacterium]
MHLLVYKSTLDWPRLSGHDVHTYEMMKAWIELGNEVSLATYYKPTDVAIAGLKLNSTYSINDICLNDFKNSCWGRALPERFANYWGISRNHTIEFAEIANEINADVVIVSGLDCLPMLYNVSGAKRVWYAADEWFWHHLSLVKPFDIKSWIEVYSALIKGLYEWSYRKFMDRIWVVTKSDARAMHRITGINNIDILPNGVDASYFHQLELTDEIPKSLIFWGRLDFLPNIQALDWFCKKIWPAIVSKNKDAVFTIMGANPTQFIKKLKETKGVRLLADVEDLRPEINRSQIVVLPFTSGGGIKNKLLEAAAMGKPIVCSQSATNGLNGTPPMMIAHTPQEWSVAIEKLWNDAELRHISGMQAREWVCKEHSWMKTATVALASLKSLKG